jgi:hypothetical protein
MYFNEIVHIFVLYQIFRFNYNIKVKLLIPIIPLLLYTILDNLYQYLYLQVNTILLIFIIYILILAYIFQYLCNTLFNYNLNIKNSNKINLNK